MPRLTNPGDISTGPGKAISTDTDRLVLKDVGAFPAGVGAYIPPGETTPRAGYPALPCRACGGGTGGSSGVSDEETILTVGLPNANPAWVGFTPDYTTLADAVAAAGVLMSSDGGGNPGRAVRILVVGPTIETAVPIQIQTGGLIIEGYSYLEGTNGAVTWSSDQPLIDLMGRDNLVFRNLKFAWTGLPFPAPPPLPPTLRLLFSNSGTSKLQNLVIDNCECTGNIQGFLYTAPDFGSDGKGMESCQITRNRAKELLEFGVVAFDLNTYAPMSGCIIRDNVFVNSTTPVYAGFFPAIGMLGLIASNTTSIKNNIISGFWEGISPGTAPSMTGTTEIRDNFIAGTMAHGIYLEGGTANQVTGNTLLNVDTDGGGIGLYVDCDDSLVDSNHVSTMMAGSTAIELGTTGSNSVCSQNDVTEDATGLIGTWGTLTVVTENKAKKIDSYGTNCTVSLNLVSSGGDMEIHGSETTVQGNNIANDLFIRTSFCTVEGNRISANFAVANEGHDSTIGDNHIGGNFDLGGASINHTVSGNFVGGDVTEVSGNNVFTGNDVGGTFTTTGPACVVEGNRLASITVIGGDESTVNGNKCIFLLQVDGDGCTISGNRCDQNLVVTGASEAITGNWVGLTLSTSPASSFCTIGDNVAEDIICGGANCTVGSNTVGNDIQVLAQECTISGNQVVGNLDVQGTDCTIVGNKCNLLFNSVGGGPPAVVIIVGNRYMDGGMTGVPEFGFPANTPPPAGSSVGNF